ncbi:MAG: hypothetical protein V3T05_09870 [Myxococcota bacterium]
MSPRIRADTRRDADTCPPCGTTAAGRQVRRNGKTKAYYIGWSVADWIFAGQMWLGAGFFGLVTLGAGIEASEQTGPDNGALVVAIWTGLITAGLTITGIFAAHRGSENRRIYHEMLAEERSAVGRPGSR